MNSNSAEYQRSWRKKNPNYQNNWNKAVKISLPKPLTIREKENKMKREKEDKDKAGHREVFLDCEDADEGIL